MGYPYQETKYGFDWGPASLERCCSDPKFGVVLVVRTPKQQYQIRVTPSGIVRINKEPKR